jgi:hypothetical protein
MSRFILAFPAEARSIAIELSNVVRQVSVPVAVLFSDAERPFAMFDDMLPYPWMLPPFTFRSADDLSRSLRNKIVPALERKVQELASRRRVLPA